MHFPSEGFYRLTLPICLIHFLTRIKAYIHAYCYISDICWASQRRFHQNGRQQSFDGVGTFMSSLSISGPYIPIVFWKRNLLTSSTVKDLSVWVYKSKIRIWFLTISPIGNLSFYVDPEGFLVLLSFYISQLGVGVKFADRKCLISEKIWI